MGTLGGPLHGLGKLLFYRRKGESKGHARVSQGPPRRLLALLTGWSTVRIKGTVSIVVYITC